MEFKKLNEQFNYILNNLGNPQVLEEGYKDKVNKIEKIIGKKLSNLEEVFIKKFESKINWGIAFDIVERNVGYHPARILLQLNNDSWNLMYNLEDGGTSQIDFIDSLSTYMEGNQSVYEEMGIVIVLTHNDFQKRYKGKADAFPTFDSAVFAEVYQEIKDDPNFGNIMKIYERKAKEMISAESEFGGKNKWVVLEGGDKGSKEFEQKSKRQMALASKKTSWCVRGQAGCNYYPNDDFHFYLDKDGDAIISLRFRDGTLDEVSGSESDQSLTDEEKQIASDYIFKEKKFTDLNKNNVKRRLEGFINLPKPEKFKNMIADWARKLYEVKTGGNYNGITLSFEGYSKEDVAQNEVYVGSDYTDDEIKELQNYIDFTNPKGSELVLDGRERYIYIK